ncbi:MAG: hypothetical protein ACKVT1_16115 [Dehalococcoidia bacterium]
MSSAWPRTFSRPSYTFGMATETTEAATDPNKTSLIIVSDFI